MGRTTARLMASLLLLTLPSAGAPVWAEAPAATEPGFSEQIDVRAVNVEVVVTDAQGRRVHGLKAADFKLLVDGREERIDYFAEVADGAAPNPAVPAPAAPAAPATSAVAASAAAASSGVPPSPPAPQTPPSLAAGGRVGTSYLVFIDDVFSVASQRNAALSSLERDLSLLGPDDRMAVVAYAGGKLTLLSGWSGDLAALKKAFKEAERRRTYGARIVANRRGDLRVERMNTQDLYEDADLLSVVPGPELWEIEQNTSGVGRAASAAAAALRGVPVPAGRKVMMVLAGGWPWDGDPKALRPLTVAANLLGYTLYPVHVPGYDPLVVPSDAEIAETSTSADSRYETGGGPIVTGWEKISEGALKVLAQSTGGVAALNRQHSLKQVIEDTRSYYWLGFSPIWKADDRAHGIAVTVARPGLTVRSRRSFFDLGRGTVNALTAESLLLLDGDPAQKRLSVTAAPLRRIDSRVVELPLTILIPSEALTPLPDVQSSHVVLGRISFASLDEAGRQSQLPSQTLRATLPEAPRPGGYVRFKASLRLRSTAQRLVISVQDPTSGAMLWGDLEVKL